MAIYAGGDGGEAMKIKYRVHRSPPDIVVMDVGMPVMDGVEATRSLASAEGITSPPVLILTTYKATEAVYRALSAGACGFTLKDAVPAELIAAIKAIVGGEGWPDPGVTRSLLREFEARGHQDVNSVSPPHGVPSQPDDSSTVAFIHEGEFWTVSFKGKVSRLKDSVGLGYLWLLLQHPGRELHVLDLVSRLRGDLPRHGTSTDRSSGSLFPSDHIGPVIDKQAKNAYRNRLEDLQHELEEAERWGDTARAGNARQELDAITEHLSASLGLGGRTRRPASAAERARVNVTKAVRGAIRRISSDHQSLGVHLSRSIRTGTFCSYEPEDAPMVNWSF